MPASRTLSRSGRKLSPGTVKASRTPAAAIARAMSCATVCVGALTSGRDMVASGATRIVECGPGKVLTSLNRRIERNKDIAMQAVEDPASLAAALAQGAAS